MPYSTKRSLDDCKEQYNSIEGKDPTWLGDIFGQVNHEIFYQEMESWCSFIDSVFPDYFPINIVQGCLMSIVKSIYFNQSVTKYYWGAKQGDQLITEFDKLITDTQSKINAAIADARNYIETNLFNPLRDRINSEIKPLLDQAESRLNEMGFSMNGLNSQINAAKTSLQDHERRLKLLEAGIKGANPLALFGLMKEP